MGHGRTWQVHTEGSTKTSVQESVRELGRLVEEVRVTDEDDRDATDHGEHGVDGHDRRAFLVVRREFGSHGQMRHVKERHERAERHGEGREPEKDRVAAETPA